MEEALPLERLNAEQDRRLSEAFEREKRRLRNFIRQRVPDDIDAEDILQDVFSELVEAYRLMKPVAHAGAWLFQVARNRITDLFRKRKPSAVDNLDDLRLEEWLPSSEAGPEAVFARSVLLDEIDAALSELSKAQRDVFIAHQIEGRAFKNLAEETGVSVSTLLSRKHYAVLYLRRRLRNVYDEWEK